MKFPISLSLILSQVRAFLYTTPKVKVKGTTESRIQGLPRCKSTDSFARIEEMEACTLDSPKETEKKMRFGDNPVDPRLELLLEATPLVVLGVLGSLCNN